MSLRDTHHYLTKPKSDLPAMLSLLTLSKGFFYVDSTFDSVRAATGSKTVSHFYVDSTSARTGQRPHVANGPNDGRNFEHGEQT